MSTRVFSFICFVVVIISLFTSSVSAMKTGFVTSEVSQELQDKVWRNMKLSVHLTYDERASICSFDVNDNGMIALGLCNNTINIYSEETKYLYSYKFMKSGTYYVEWAEETLIIYLVRSDTAVAVDDKGNLVEMKEITNTLHNNDYWYSLRMTHKQLNDTKYLIRNKSALHNLFTSSYSEMVKIDPDGTETVIYDVSARQGKKILWGALLVIIIFTYVITLTLYKWKKVSSDSS